MHPTETRSRRWRGRDFLLRKSGKETKMLTYIIRRLLYSIVVLDPRKLSRLLLRRKGCRRPTCVAP